MTSVAEFTVRYATYGAIATEDLTVSMQMAQDHVLPSDWLSLRQSRRHTVCLQLQYAMLAIVCSMPHTPNSDNYWLYSKNKPSWLYSKNKPSQVSTVIFNINTN